MERQPPFAGEGGHLPPRNFADMLDRDGRVRRFRQESLVMGIDDDADREQVNDGRGKAV